MAAAGPAKAQNGESFRDGADAAIRYNETPFEPAGQCEYLVSRSDGDFSVLSADLHKGDSVAPAHCRVTAVIPAEIVFELNLPLAWNGRFYMYGNGGFAGSPPSSRADVRDQALRQGFATSYTNTGHDARREPGATFAHDNLQKTLDYLFRAVHLTVVHSKEVIAEYYGRETDYSYWDGCSMGGRQGMVSAQRFPEDFDGIVAGAPAFDFTGTMLSYVWQGREMRKLDLSPAKLDLLAETVYGQCDAKDGLEDGLISDPRRCDFSPERHLPRCSGEKPMTCFGDEEIVSLQRLYDGPERDGRSLHPGVVPGAEATGVVAGPDGARRQARGWEPWLINPGGMSFQTMMVQSYLRYLAFEIDDPDYDWTEFPVETEPEGLDQAVLRLLDAKEADLTRFRDRGGKILTWFGWADAAISPLPIIDYFEEVAAATGNVPEDFYRLYMIPGTFHCDGGVGAGEADFMTPLIEWVEAGKRPAAITGFGATGDEQFSRPLCPWPQQARYTGSGSTSVAENFECARLD